MLCSQYVYRLSYVDITWRRKDGRARGRAVFSEILLYHANRKKKKKKTRMQWPASLQEPKFTPLLTHQN